MSTVTSPHFHSRSTFDGGQVSVASIVPCTRTGEMKLRRWRENDRDERVDGRRRLYSNTVVRVHVRGYRGRFSYLRKERVMASDQNATEHWSVSSPFILSPFL